MQDFLLNVEGVKKSYGRHQVLQGGRLRATTGQLVCVLGENGSGKSTLMKIIAGILKPDAGNIFCRGQIGYCPQDSRLYDYLTVNEHFQLFGKAYDLDRGMTEKNASELMDVFNFPAFRNHKINELSGGTRQKLNLSLALLHDPELLLLDEPYAGFDWETYQHFLNYTEQAKSMGKCIIMVSHLVFDRDRFDSIFTVHQGIIQKENA